MVEETNESAMAIVHDMDWWTAESGSDEMLF